MLERFRHRLPRRPLAAGQARQSRRPASRSTRPRTTARAPERGCTRRRRRSQGKPFTTQGDVYALGVLLYQMAVGDLARPLAPGWERDVPDELLREDIAACVEGDPQRRLSGAHELSERLRTLPQRRQALINTREAARRAHRRRTLLRVVGTAAALLAIVVAGVAVAVVREQPGCPDPGRIRSRGEPARRAQKAQCRVKKSHRPRALPTGRLRAPRGLVAGNDGRLLTSRVRRLRAEQTGVCAVVRAAPTRAEPRGHAVRRLCTTSRFGVRLAPER